MSTYRLTPAAQDDLASIWDYTEERRDARQAQGYVEEIYAVVQRLAASPLLGRPCDEIRAGYRQYGVGSHILFYMARFEADAGVDVIRILHQRVDPTRHL